MWSCSLNLDDANIIYAGLNTGRIQVFDQRQVQSNESTLSSSIETLSLSTSSPIPALQYIQKTSHFPSSGFYEYVSICEYHFHELSIDKNLSSLKHDPNSNRLIDSFRPQSNPRRHELYELITQPNQSLKISLELVQT